jgi:iron complex transport system substrate-binding protein
MKKLAALLCTGLALAHGTANAAPRRVVSLNPCLDVVLVNVADRDQIAALSHYSRDKNDSTIAAIAASFPITYESAEEIMALEPDLVLTSRHSDLATRNALGRLNIKTELFSEPQNVAESLEAVRRVAGLVAQEARGEEVIARIQAALDAAAPPTGVAPVPALIFQRNGFSSGRGTLVDEMMTRTGFVNLADRYGLTWWSNVLLERVVADPPVVLLAGEMRPDMPAWADRVLRHPALRAMEPKMTRAAFPDRLLFCGGPVLIESAAALAKARKHATGEGP